MKQQYVLRFTKILLTIAILLIIWYPQEILRNHRHTVALIEYYQELLDLYDPEKPPEEKISYSPGALADLKKRIKLGEQSPGESCSGVKRNIDSPLFWTGFGFLIGIILVIIEHRRFPEDSK